jgi:O-antigen/teichoic acid export membrane protein
MKRPRHFIELGKKLLHTILVDWLVVLFGLGFTQGMLALALIIVARQVSTVEYGQYMACYGLLSLLVVLPNLGLDVWILAEGGSGSLDITNSWKSAIRLRFFLLCGWLAAIFILSMVLPAQTFPIKIMIPTALGSICDSLTLLTYNSWRVQKRHKRVALFQIIFPMSLLAITYLAKLQNGQIVIFSIIRAAISFLNLLFVLIPTIKGLTPGLKRLPAKQMLRAARPYVLADVATSIYMKADLTIISFFLGSAGAGIYGPALNLTNLLFMVPNALYLVALPNLSKRFRDERISFWKFGLGQTIVQGISGAVLSLLIFQFAPLIIKVAFGDAYGQSGLAFRLMSPILFIKSLNFALGAILTAGDYQIWRTSTQVISALFNLVANLLVVIPIGIVGVIWVYIFSEILLLIGYSIPVLRQRLRKEALILL